MKSVVLAVAATGLALAGAAAAADAPLTPSQTALDGYWRMPPPPRPPGAPPPDGPPPDRVAMAATPLLTPSAAAFHAKYEAAEAAGVQQRTPNNLCIPSEVPGIGVPGGPAYQIEIQVEPKLVAFLYEENRTIRLVHIGSAHPADLKPSWLGQSVGHWEGDTLVVDTLGFNDRNMLTEGIPMSARMHIVERLRVVGGQLEDQATFTDPEVLKAPLMITSRFTRGEPFQEYICAENNHEGGVPTADGAPTPSAIP